MEYKFNTRSYRKLFLIFSPVCFIVWLGFLKFILSDHRATDSEVIRSVIFFSVLFLPGAPLLAFYGLDMDYDINILENEIRYVKRGLIRKADIKVSFSRIKSVKETLFNSLLITTDDGKNLKIVKYLSVDFGGLDHKAKSVFDALEVNPSSKVVSFIKLLIIKKIGASDDFQPSAKENRAFMLLNG